MPDPTISTNPNTEQSSWNPPKWTPDDISKIETLFNSYAPGDYQALGKDETESEIVQALISGISTGNTSLDRAINTVFPVYLYYNPETRPEPKGILGGLWANIRNFFQIQIRTAVAEVGVWFSNLLGTTSVEVRKNRAEAQLQSYLDMGIIDRNAYDFLVKINTQGGGLGGIWDIMLTVGMLLNMMHGASTTLTSAFIKNQNETFRPQVADANSIMGASFLAPELGDKVRAQLRKAGYEEEQIDLMYASLYAPLTVTDIQQQYYRRGFDKDYAFGRLRQLGLTDSRIEEIMDNWQFIPSVSDLIEILQKEGFEPDIQAAFGLLDDFPTEQAEWFSKQGISEYWQQKYWIAHWQHLGAGQVLDMLHRGIIDDSAVNTFYKQIDIAPYWRDKITKINYFPYTRVDTRRMYETNTLNEAEVLRNYLDLGYDQQHAEKMTEFTIKARGGTSKTIAEGKITRAYKDSVITFDDASALLQKLGYSKDQAAFTLALIDYDEQVAYDNEIVKNTQEQYIYGFIDQQTAREQLGALELPDRKIQYLLQRWDITKRRRDKRPTKAELDKWLTSGLLTETEWRTEMGYLGYADRYIELFLKELQLKQPGV